MEAPSESERAVSNQLSATDVANESGDARHYLGIILLNKVLQQGEREGMKKRHLELDAEKVKENKLRKSP